MIEKPYSTLTLLDARPFISPVRENSDLFFFFDLVACSIRWSISLNSPPKLFSPLLMLISYRDFLFLFSVPLPIPATLFRRHLLCPPESPQVRFLRTVPLVESSSSLPKPLAPCGTSLNSQALIGCFAFCGPISFLVKGRTYWIVGSHPGDADAGSLSPSVLAQLSCQNGRVFFPWGILPLLAALCV